jgi:hypothetical protein
VYDLLLKLILSQYHCICIVIVIKLVHLITVVIVVVIKLVHLITVVIVVVIKLVHLITVTRGTPLHTKNKERTGKRSLTSALPERWSLTVLHKS